MAKKKIKKVFISRPANKSFKAFKEWIMSVTACLTGEKEVDDMSEKEWRKLYNQFVGKNSAK